MQIWWTTTCLPSFSLRIVAPITSVSRYLCMDGGESTPGQSGCWRFITEFTCHYGVHEIQLWLIGRMIWFLSDQMICFLWYDACLCRQTIGKVIWQQLMTQAPLICIDWSILGNIYWMSLSRSATSKLGCSPPFPILEQTERPCTGNTILPLDPVNFGRILGEGRKKV
jgi:hypothetical protein